MVFSISPLCLRSTSALLTAPDKELCPKAWAICNRERGSRWTAAITLSWTDPGSQTACHSGLDLHSDSDSSPDSDLGLDLGLDSDLDSDLGLDSGLDDSDSGLNSSSPSALGAQGAASGC